MCAQEQDHHEITVNLCQERRGAIWIMRCAIGKGRYVLQFDDSACTWQDELACGNGKYIWALEFPPLDESNEPSNRPGTTVSQPLIVDRWGFVVDPQCGVNRAAHQGKDASRDQLYEPSQLNRLIWVGPELSATSLTGIQTDDRLPRPISRDELERAILAGRARILSDELLGRWLQLESVYGQKQRGHCDRRLLIKPVLGGPVPEQVRSKAPKGADAGGTARGGEQLTRQRLRHEPRSGGQLEQLTHLVCLELRDDKSERTAKTLLHMWWNSGVPKGRFIELLQQAREITKVRISAGQVALGEPGRRRAMPYCLAVLRSLLPNGATDA